MVDQKQTISKTYLEESDQTTAGTRWVQAPGGLQAQTPAPSLTPSQFIFLEAYRALGWASAVNSKYSIHCPHQYAQKPPVGGEAGKDKHPNNKCPSW
jgi:hypothetical protein